MPRRIDHQQTTWRWSCRPWATSLSQASQWSSKRYRHVWCSSD